ncbi:hypothetical protein C8J56DRAFT_1022513 [Mycena floridula]|nr:hypothetical protein C8J56DRAFT_1022513 [Mycena floridula]
MNPTRILDHVQNFGRILKINTGQYYGSTIIFASPEDAKQLLDTATSGEITIGGRVCRIKPQSVRPELPSSHLSVSVHKRTVRDTDIHNAFSKFGPIKNVSKPKEFPGMGGLSYMVQFIVEFENAEDAVKANWTLVWVDGGLLQTRLGLPREEILHQKLIFAIQPPWNSIRPGYHREMFVEDLARRANIPMDELAYKFDFDDDRGLNTLMLTTKNIEAAQKIKAIPSSEMHNAKFSVRYYRPPPRPIYQKKRK